ncbi:outer membrane beta-barrel protein [Nannocystis radixulma]|uniref:Outer membrane beta-barrel protein n=1 Tax=Nannocystis radixulma TaxID=2995305 RepID=A0ABT5AWX5_9BACT|nr:outer membrane beta-barrel protein [Nannocystis radixulma]MDC0666342.1 outer membrane beta-barrel protein [Nannocystis radixulma]
MIALVSAFASPPIGDGDRAAPLALGPWSPADGAKPASSVPATAEPLVPAKRPRASPSAWVVGGFVDMQYVMNSNFPDNHLFRGTPVTARTGEFSPNLLVGYVRKDPVASPWMFEVALQAGAAADAVYAADPVPGGDSGHFAGPETWKHIGRAWGGVRLRSGVELAVGLMPAPTHFGSFWTKDNWHASITWGYSSVPFVLTGLRAFVPLGARAGVSLWLVNGYGTLADVNRAPSGLVNLLVGVAKGWTLVQNVYAGPESVDLRVSACRVLLDSQIVYMRERWGVALVGDYGRERLTWLEGQPVAAWANGMVSLRWQVLAGRRVRWGMAARPEFFWDHRGRIFGGPALDRWLVGGTYTNDVHLFGALLLRVEYRYDRALGEGGFFYRREATVDGARGLAVQQHSLIFGFVVYIERGFAALRR